MNRYFTKEDIQMADKHMKKLFNIISIREMQIKNHNMRYYYTTIRMAKIKKRERGLPWWCSG